MHMQSYGSRMSKSAPCSPVKPVSKRPHVRADSFHVVHKVPVGDTPYVKAKHVQLVDKDPDRAIALFWAAINAGDRVDSALKDMAIVMKQQNRPQEAIEAIKSLRNRCSDQAQESLDNVLLDLYKRCGRLDDQIDLLKHKLHLIHQGMAFNGKRTKTARSQGKKFQVSIEQEATRLLGNLGWAYMQQSNFVAAEAVYRKALSIEPDNNKVCNLGICLMKQGRLEEAKSMLQSVTPACNDNRWASDSHLKSYERAQEMLQELEASMGTNSDVIHKELRSFAIPGCDTGYDLQHSSLWQPQPALPRQPRRMARSSLDQQFSQTVDPAMTSALLATAGFGPQKQVSVAARATQPQGEQPWYQTGWSDEDLDNSSPEDSDAVTPQFALAGTKLQPPPFNWHAETLRQRLETVSVLGNAFMSRHLAVKIESSRNEQSLSCDAAPFNPAVSKEPAVTMRPKPAAGNGGVKALDRAPLTFDLTNGNGRNGANASSQEENRGVKTPGSWTASKPNKSTAAGYANSWTTRNEHSENHQPTQPTQPTARRSLSMGDIDTTPFAEQQQPQSQPQPQPLQSQNVNINITSGSSGLPPLHNAVGKRCRTLTPVKEKTVSAWGSLGFTQSPNDLDFGCENNTASLEGDLSNGSAGGSLIKSLFSRDPLAIPMADLSASEMEMKRQRRLKVFREMTLAGSPQA